MLKQSPLRLLLLAFTCFASSAAAFQTDTIALINSGRVMEEALALHAESQYDQAIEKFLSIPESDTNYVWMRSELIVSYLDKEDYDNAIRLGEAGINERSAYKARFYVALGNAYMGNGQFDKALQVYQQGLKLFPYDFLLFYNQGLAYAKKEEFDQAISSFQQSISINPYYANAHYFLGNMMIAEGKRAKAMMCLGTYLALMPSNNNALVQLNNLLNNAITFENSHPKEEKLASFRDLDLLIKSNAALDKKFKSTVAFKAPVAQQLELLLESLPAEEKGDDFWLKLYVPLFRKIYQGGAKEAFIYHVLTSVDDKGVQKWHKSNGKSLEKYYDIANEQLKAFRSQRVATLSGEKNTYSFWYYDNNRLNAIGNQIDDETYTGPWLFFYPNGVVKAEGVFTQTGTKKGRWKYYTEAGSLKKQEDFNAKGEVEGMFLEYYADGQLESEIPYKAGEIDGLVKLYFPCGELKEALHYKAGKREGAGTEYYPTGQVRSRYSYKANEPVSFTYYYKNGTISEAYLYQEGALNGEFKSFHKNARQSQQGQYIGGKMTGEWKSFYADGNLKSTGSYLEDLKSGVWQHYSEEGKLELEETFDAKGILHGKTKQYNNAGDLHYEYDYQAGNLVGYKYFNKAKSVLSEAANAKGNFKIKGYDSDGNLLFEGAYTNGKANGTFVYYFKNGQKSSIVPIKDDAYHGPYQTFYESGQKNLVTTYEDGVMNGYYRLYHKNGQLKTEGWLIDGKTEQLWVNYHPDGSIADRQYYLQGENHGLYEQFDAHGRPYIKSNFTRGLLQNRTQFDTLGTAIMTSSFTGGSGKSLFYFADKKPRFETALQCGEIISDLKSYHKGGSIYSVTPVKNGEYNGPFKTFYPNQKLRTEGQYTDNEQHGLWTWYFESGKVDAKINLKESKPHGERIDYHDDGSKSIVAQFVAGDRVGSTSYYAPDGSLQIEKIYDAFGLTSYRYLGKDNKPVDFIALKNYDGPVKAFFPNGNVSVEQNYKNSYLEGRQVMYYPSGKPMEVMIVKDGQEEGLREVYYPDGKLKKTSPYRYDELHGQVVEYYSNGKVKRKTSYLFGQKEGWEINYDQGGKMVSKIYYRDDNVY